MDLSIAGITAVVGILSGLNFIGLFVAAYFFDRSAKQVLFYLGAVAALMANGVSYLLSLGASDPLPFLKLSEFCQASAFLLLALGLERALALRLSTRFLWLVFAAGSMLTAILPGQGHLDLARLTAASAWHVVVIGYVVVALLRAPGAGLKHRLLALLVAGLGLAVASRVPTALFVRAFHPDVPLPIQVDMYSVITNTTYLAALFGLGAGLVFSFMSAQAAGYRNASITDGLTGLLNRVGFMDAAHVASAPPAALIMMDIDHFKAVNDTWGHDAGDRVIAEIAAIMRQAVPEPHICGRLGGEEFAVLLQRTELPTARAQAQSLRTAIAIGLDGFLSQGHAVTASLGVASIGGGGLEEALIAADRALYKAKRTGRNKVCMEGSDRRWPRRAVLQSTA